MSAVGLHARKISRRATKGADTHMRMSDLGRTPLCKSSCGHRYLTRLSQLPFVLVVLPGTRDILLDLYPLMPLLRLIQAAVLASTVSLNANIQLVTDR